MTNKHTPGPWKAVPSSNKGNGSGWRDIVSMGGAFTPSYVGEALDQDAALISAAPELLEQAKNALNVLAGIASGDLKTIKQDSPAILGLRAIIAKAEGL
jgi:hypothetical protein